MSSGFAKNLKKLAACLCRGRLTKLFNDYGGVGQRPVEGEAEKPEALKRGGDFPLLTLTLKAKIV
jgi:hypothetical protein